jgi:hypothetical protein
LQYTEQEAVSGLRFCDFHQVQPLDPIFGGSEFAPNLRVCATLSVGEISPERFRRFRVAVTAFGAVVTVTKGARLALVKRVSLVGLARQTRLTFHPRGPTFYSRASLLRLTFMLIRLKLT